MRGNAVDLAVGVVMGAAFGGVVTALVKDLLTPLVAAIFRAPDFSGLSFTLNHSKFLYGDFFNAAISFLLVAVGVYFFVIVPMNSFLSRFKKPAAALTKKCPECLSEISVNARRCSYCAQPISQN